jgi:hypothetical protein
MRMAITLSIEISQISDSLVFSQRLSVAPMAPYSNDICRRQRTILQIPPEGRLHEEALQGKPMFDPRTPTGTLGDTCLTAWE